MASNIQASLRTVQDSAERAALRIVSQRAAKAMEGAKSVQWLPQGPVPPGTSAYVTELVDLLLTVGDRWLDGHVWGLPLYYEL